MTARGRGVLVALASLLVSLAAAELVLRRLSPLPDPYRRLKGTAVVRSPGTAYIPSAFAPRHRMATRAEPGLPGFDPRVRVFTVNELGFRGPPLRNPKPADELRVFLVGGSAIECAVLADPEAVNARLQARLEGRFPGRRVRVYGAGKSGDTSIDHVAMVAHRIAQLQPDLLVVMAGANDMVAVLRGRPYLDRAAGAVSDSLIPGGRLLGMAATELQLVRLAYAVGTGTGTDSVQPTSVRAHAEATAGRRRAAGPPRVRTGPYAVNLRTLAGIAAGQRVPLILMTQPTSWRSPEPAAVRWHWMTGWPERYPEVALDSALGEYNQVMREVAAEQGVPLIDLAATLPRSMTYFYDDMHFNPRGADELAARLAPVAEAALRTRLRR